MKLCHRTVSKAKSDARTFRLWVPCDKRELIDRAAAIVGKSRSEFMIDAAVAAAQEARLDQSLIRVDQPTYDKFNEILDQPPSGEGFEGLMRARAPWLE